MRFRQTSEACESEHIADIEFYPLDVEHLDLIKHLIKEIIRK